MQYNRSEIGSDYWYLPGQGRYTTPTGLKLADKIEWFAAKLGLVSYRRYARLALERNDMIRHCHKMAIESNRIQDENIILKRKLSRKRDRNA